MTIPYQLLPALTDEEYADLKADIAERGVQVPVLFDEVGAIIDGHHRVRACRELGITDFPREVRTGLSDDDKASLSLALNIHRRQLDRAQRRGLVAELRQRGWSTRRIAAETGYPDRTVARDIQSIAPNGAMPERIVTADGRSYPAQRSTTEHVCTVCGEIFDHRVWHCEECDHHWPMSVEHCRTCHTEEPSTASTVAALGGALPPPPAPTPEERVYERLHAAIGLALGAIPEDVARIAAGRGIPARFANEAAEFESWFARFRTALDRPALRRVQ